MSTRYLRAVPHALPDDVQLWFVSLDPYAESMRLGSLPRGDLQRAARMATERHARRFLACRHVLYRVLADALGRSPEDIVLTADAFGKLDFVGSTLQFNLSRSGGQALIGLSRGTAIGVDIEHIRNLNYIAEIVDRHFTSVERAEWSHVTAASRTHAFLECWTRKEACIKALGTGVSIPLSSVHAGFSSAQPRAVRVLLDGGLADVTLCSVQPPAGVAAVAMATPEAVRLAHDAAANVGTLTSRSAPSALSTGEAGDCTPPVSESNRGSGHLR